MPQNHDMKNRKMSDEPSPDVLHVTNILSWRGFIFSGSLLFVIFYWMIPAWLNHELSTLQNGTIRPIAETLLIRRIYWMQLAGITLGSICIVLAMRHYFLVRSIRSSSSKGSGCTIKFYSRLFAKLKD